MIKWLISLFKPAPISTREQHLLNCLQELREDGIELVITDRGGARLEFKDDNARKVYHKKIMDKFKQSLGK